MTKFFRRKHDKEPEMTVEERMARLREKLWKARNRRSKAAGVSFLLLSGLFLALAFFTRYLLFEVTSILALLLGVVYVFFSLESYMKTSVANRVVISSLIPLDSLLTYLKVKGKALHIPPALGERSGKIFLSFQKNVGIPSTFDELMKDDDVTFLKEGILLPSIGSALLQLYENELGDLRNLDLAYLMAWLPRILTDDFQIAEKIEMAQKMDEIHVTMTDFALSSICDHPKAKIVCELTGCPLCSSFAEALAKNTNRLIYYLDCRHDIVKGETHAVYRLGETLETLKRVEKARETKHDKS